MKTDTSIHAADLTAYVDLHADDMLEAIVKQARSLSARDIVIGKTTVVFRTHRTFYEKMTLAPEYTRALMRRIASLSQIDGRIRLYGKFVHFGAHPVLLYAAAVQGGIALRIRGCPRALPPPEGLGLCGAQIEALRKLSAQRNGLVIFCSPDERRISTAAISIFSDMRRTGKASRTKPPCILYLLSLIHISEPTRP